MNKVTPSRHPDNGTILTLYIWSPLILILNPPDLELKDLCVRYVSTATIKLCSILISTSMKLELTSETILHSLREYICKFNFWFHGFLSKASSTSLSLLRFAND